MMKPARHQVPGMGRQATRDRQGQQDEQHQCGNSGRY